MNFLILMRFEFRTIFHNVPVMLTVIAAPIFYLMLYPSPYLTGVPTKQTIVIIDHDQTSLSHQIIRDTNASPKIKVVAKVGSIQQAKKMIESGKARGFLIIPNNFKHNLLLGQQSTLSYGADASYFLVFGAIAKTLTVISMEISKKIQRSGSLFHGASIQEMHLSLNPIKLNTVPVFNPTISYNPYLIPGLLLLLLHQTMLIALGTIGATQWQKKGYWSRVSAVQLVSARLLAFLCIYSLLTALYIGWGFMYYGVTLVADLRDMLLLMIPFLLSVATLGIWLSCFFKNTERPTQVFLLMGMPIIFLAGFVWPIILIPKLLVNFSQLIPAIPAIMTMLKLNELGAPWASTIGGWLQLWALFIVFGAFAIYNVRQRQKDINTRIAPIKKTISHNDVQSS
ncbi:MAG: ABC transporter permease [Psychromonas sp.]|nr:ABC transporter permease [Psychromonas sp.]